MMGKKETVRRVAIHSTGGLMWLIACLKGVLLLSVISLLWIRPEPASAGGLKDFVSDLYGGDGITLAPPIAGFKHQPH